LFFAADRPHIGEGLSKMNNGVSKEEHKKTEDDTIKRQGEQYLLRV
jgi:hypothetical protein